MPKGEAVPVPAADTPLEVGADIALAEAATAAEATADEDLAVDSPDKPLEEGLQEDLVDFVVATAGLALDLASPMPQRPIGLAITGTRIPILTITLIQATGRRTTRVRW